MKAHKQKLFINATALDQRSKLFFLLLQKLRRNFKSSLLPFAVVFVCVCKRAAMFFCRNMRQVSNAYSRAL